MKTVFVTGGIGSGKSAFCDALRSMGIPVYDSDSRTKQLYDSDPDIIPSLEKALDCPSLMDESGHLDKKLLASIIFSDKEKLLILESIVHPAVLRDFDSWKTSLESEGCDAPFVVMESALVLEKPLFFGKADIVLLVDAPIKIRLERACLRDSAKREAIQARINSQSIDCSRADVVIANDSTLDELFRKAKVFYESMVTSLDSAAQA